jgi:KDO2-lipid IV(A) lauroyltransferase
MKWYYPILAFPLYLLFSLPLWLLYGLSTVVYVILYYLIGYRKKVVRTNLANSFPDKTQKERMQIEKDYYKHMVDVMIETLKLLTLSRKQLSKHVVFTNLEVLKQLPNQQQPFIFVLGHQGNWEWIGPAFASLHFIQLHGLYHPLSSPFFDWLMKRIRTRHGMKLIPMQQTMRALSELKNTFTGIAFIADQTPAPENAYWLQFLHQDTPAFVGTEKIARRFDYPVVYVSTKKLKRGRYELTFQIITLQSGSTNEGWITREHTRLLENDIINQPAIWLWSHRRWKHKRVKT